MQEYTVFYRFRANTEQFRRSLDKVDTSLKHMRASLGSVQTKANEMAGSTMGLAAKLGVVIGGMAVPIYRFENATNAMVAASGKNRDEMQSVINLTRKLGKETEHSAENAMQGAKNLAQAGFSANQILKLLPQTLQLATAGALDMATASGDVASAIKAFGMNVNDSQRVVDVVAKSASMAKMSVGDLGQMYGKVGGIAKLNNLSFETTVAMFMALKNAGLETSTSATGLGSVMARLSKPTKEVRDAFYGLGLDIDSLIKNGKNFEDIIKLLSTKQLKGAQVAAIFGKEQQKVGINLVKSYKDIQQFTKALNHSTGAAQEMQNKMNYGFIGAVNKLKSAFSDLILQSGDQGLTGALTHISISLTNLINKLSASNLNWQKIIKTILISIAALFAFGIAMKVVSTTALLMRGVITVFILLKKAILGAVWAMKLLSSPAVMLGFVGVAISAIALIWQYWDDVKVYINNILEWFTNKIEWIKNKVHAVKNFFDFGSDDNKLDINKTEKIQRENKVNSESIQKIKLDNNTRVDGTIKIENNSHDYIARLESLNMGTQ